MCFIPKVCQVVDVCNLLRPDGGLFKKKGNRDLCVNTVTITNSF